MKYFAKSFITILVLYSLMVGLLYVPYNVYSPPNAINISDYDLAFPTPNSQNSSLQSENVTSLFDSD